MPSDERSGKDELQRIRIQDFRNGVFELGFRLPQEFPQLGNPVLLLLLLLKSLPERVVVLFLRLVRLLSGSMNFAARSHRASASSAGLFTHPSDSTAASPATTTSPLEKLRRPGERATVRQPGAARIRSSESGHPLPKSGMCPIRRPGEDVNTTGNSCVMRSTIAELCSQHIAWNYGMLAVEPTTMG